MFQDTDTDVGRNDGGLPCARILTLTLEEMMAAFS